MIRHELQQNSFDAAAAPLSLQSNTYPPPYREQAALLASTHGHSGAHPAYAVPGRASPADAGAWPTMILSVALTLTLLLSWTAYREVIRLRRVLARYRAYFKTALAPDPVPLGPNARPLWR
jgi:hypothetical protein